MVEAIEVCPICDITGCAHIREAGLKATIATQQERIQQLESKAAALYTLAERTCGDGCHCMKENNEKCALMETDK